LNNQRTLTLPERSLVSISEASRILGVSEATLRQWTDDGKIQAFVTPGGHRRYSRVDIRRFAGLQRKVHGVKDLVTELQEAASLQRGVAQLNFPATSWYGKLGDESYESLAQCGRQLLGLVIRYVTEPSKQEETIELARDVGRDFGIELIKQGLSLTDALEAFLLHRTPFVTATTNLMKKREMLNERAVEAIPLVNRIMDEALVSLVTAYQQEKVLPQQTDRESAR